MLHRKIIMYSTCNRDIYRRLSKDGPLSDGGGDTLLLIDAFDPDVVWSLVFFGEPTQKDMGELEKLRVDASCVGPSTLQNIIKRVQYAEFTSNLSIAPILYSVRKTDRVVAYSMERYDSDLARLLRSQ